MWLFRRPVSLAVFAAFLGLGLSLWHKGEVQVREFNRVAYSPLWSGEVDLTLPIQCIATLDNSFPAGHGMSIKLEALDDDELDLQALPTRVFVPSTSQTIELDLHGVDLSDRDWAAGRCGMETRFIGENLGDLPFDDALTIELTFNPIEGTVSAGPRRVEIWAGVCGLELLPGYIFRVLAAASGVIAAVAGIRLILPNRSPVSAAA